MTNGTDFKRRSLLASGSATLALTAASFPSAQLLAQTSSLKGLKALMERHIGQGTIPGAVWAVHRDGNTVVEHAGTFEYGGGTPMRSDTMFRIASITKPVTAALAMALVEQGRLSLDAPVDDLLPELSGPRVLVDVAGPLDDTVLAERPITLRHLLTMTFGLGAIMTFPEQYPIQAALREAGIAPGWELPALSSDEYMSRLGSLPLAYQPGARFLYNNGLDVAGILIERATGRSLDLVMRDAIFDPLGISDTGFSVPAEQLDRLPTMYFRDPQSGKQTVMDAAPDSRFAQTPPLFSGAGGLIATISDYMRFARMMLNGGELDGVRILTSESVAEMVRNQLTDEQRGHPDAVWFMANGASTWGLGMSVALQPEQPWLTPGRFGWDGGYGTSAYVDPAKGIVGLFFSQQMMTSPEPPKTFLDFWSEVYAAG
jgi:CubicO group peptidase (beta-lactamase class C family)